MSTNNEAKPSKIVQARRSSLKTHDPNSKLDPEALNKLKNKRNSVSWGQSNTFQFKAMKAMFTESNDVNQPKKETEEKTTKKKEETTKKKEETTKKNEDTTKEDTSRKETQNTQEVPEESGEDQIADLEAEV